MSDNDSDFGDGDILQVWVESPPKRSRLENNNSGNHGNNGNGGNGNNGNGDNGGSGGNGGGHVVAEMAVEVEEEAVAVAVAVEEALAEASLFLC